MKVFFPKMIISSSVSGALLGIYAFFAIVNAMAAHPIDPTYAVLPINPYYAYYIYYPIYPSNPSYPNFVESLTLAPIKFPGDSKTSTTTTAASTTTASTTTAAPFILPPTGLKPIVFPN